MEGKLEPIKFLATLTPDAVNAQGIEEMTPLHHASIEGKNYKMIFEFSHTKNSGTYLNVYFFPVKLQDI